MNLIPTITFIARNALFCFRNPRKTSTTIKAMNTYRKEHPNCEWCGGTKIDVHHIRPIHLIPEQAANPDNFISLSRKPQCHYVLGHLCNWKTGYNLKVVEMCRTRR